MEAIRETKLVVEVGEELVEELKEKEKAKRGADEHAGRPCPLCETTRSLRLSSSSSLLLFGTFFSV